MQILLKATKKSWKKKKKNSQIEAKPDENELQVETTKSWQKGNKENAGENWEKIVVQHHMAWPGRIAAG